MSDQQQNPSSQSSPDESANAPQPAHAKWSASVSLLARIASILFSRASFFWFVNLVFMAVSVLHAGLFFGLLEPASGLWGLAPYLGFAVALVLDLASIVFMQARLSALRMNERGSAAWYLFSIICCSGLSAFGNLAMSLEDFKSASLSHVGGWIQGLSPWLGVAFPLLIILISIAADKLLDIDPTNNVSVEQYKQQQQRRIDILTQRNTFLQKQTELERQERAIKHPERVQGSGQIRHVFFLVKWLFPAQQSGQPVDIDMDKLVEDITQKVTAQMDASYQLQWTQLMGALESLIEQDDVPVDALELDGQMDSIPTVNALLEPDGECTTETNIRVIRPRTSGQKTRKRTGHLERKIRTALRNNPTVPVRQLAAKLGVSPTTVSKHKRHMENEQSSVQHPQREEA